MRIIDRVKCLDLRVILALIFFIATFLRILVSFVGSNYDFESYRIVAGILNTGGSVYEETTRYNYAPVWMQVIQILDLVSKSNPVVFRYLLILFLSVADYGIFLILLKLYGWKSALIFIFNPVSIIITGYHNQFDNVAIFLGAFSVLLIDDNFKRPLSVKNFAGFFLLGVSLSVKHVLFLFPMWLAVKYRRISSKIFVLFIPTLIFFLSFLPYWENSYHEIINNVFLYRSYRNSVFHVVILEFLNYAPFVSEIILLVSLSMLAFLFRASKNAETFLAYLMVLVIVSPSVANQYLSIPVLYLAVNFNPFSLAYFVVSFFHLLFDYDGFYLFQAGNLLFRNINYAIIFLLLCLSFIATNIAKKQIER